MTTSTPSRATSVLLAWGAVLALVAADEPKKSTTGQAPDRAQEAAEVAEALKDAWPDHPEWVDMLAGILMEEPMGTEFGWFKTAVTQTRFGWESTRRRYDRDKDGRIGRRELTARDADFARLDRDRDGVLTAADFDFSGSSLAPSPGSMVFSRLDADGNGKVTRDEISSFFKRADSGGLDFLSLYDVQGAISPSPPAKPTGGSARPSKAMLVRGLFKEEVGSLQPGPKLDESAPDFTLKTNDGKTEITLSKLLGPRPVVLIFGNFTCGPFRSQAGNIEKLYRRYKDRAFFLMVYVREAHPTDGWRMESNDRVGIATTQPHTYVERAEVAQKCSRLLGLGFPMLVDSMDDRAGHAYSGMPGRLYVIDRQGKIAFKSGRGPYLFKPAELEHSLILLLHEDTAKVGDDHVSKPPSNQQKRESRRGTSKTSESSSG